MNINFFITSLGGGGAERVVCNLANFLTEEKHRVTISVLRGDDDTYSLVKNVEKQYLQPGYYKEKKSSLYRLKEISTVVNFLRKLPRGSLLVSFLELPVAYSLIFRRLYKQKLVICERNNPLFYSKGYQRIFKILSHRADGVVCQTKLIRNWYYPYMGKGTQIIVIPNSINKAILNASVVKERQKVIMTMGRLEPQKNQKLLISAFSELAEQYPDWIIHIYGKGPLENDLRKYIDELGLSGRVFLRGFTKDVISAYNSTGVFVLTSDHEGMPNVLAEAMAMGLPCISTDCGGGGARELIQDCINGLLIPCNDKGALIKALKYILNDINYGNSLGAMASKIRLELAPEKIHEQWEAFFSQFIFE